MRKHYFDELYFDKIDTEHKAYFLGFLYADGWVSKAPAHVVRLLLSEIDAEILEKFKLDIKYTGDIKTRTVIRKEDNKEFKYSSLTLRSLYFWTQSQKIGLVPAKTFEIRFPTFLHEDLVRHFVRGYFDGDGCLSGNIEGRNRDLCRKVFTFSICSNPEFCQDLIILFQKYNIKLNLGKAASDRVKIVAGRGNPKVKQIMDFLYHDSTIYLKRKHDKYLELLSTIQAPRKYRAGVSVQFDKNKKRWCVRAHIKNNKKRYGMYTTLEEANVKREEVLKLIASDTVIIRKENTSILP